MQQPYAYKTGINLVDTTTAGCSHVCVMDDLVSLNEYKDHTRSLSFLTQPIAQRLADWRKYIRPNVYLPHTVNQLMQIHLNTMQENQTVNRST